MKRGTAIQDGSSRKIREPIASRATLVRPVCNCILLLISLTHIGGVSLATDRPNVSMPNIIIVMADDMGYSDLGCYGGEIKTPVIDRLAKEGLRFSQFYNCAICGPSRASLMTGCYPWDVGQAPGTSIFANLKKNCATGGKLNGTGVN